VSKLVISLVIKLVSYQAIGLVIYGVALD